jgi:hypothetical protein
VLAYRPAETVSLWPVVCTRFERTAAVSARAAYALLTAAVVACVERPATGVGISLANRDELAAHCSANSCSPSSQTFTVPTSLILEATKRRHVQRLLVDLGADVRRDP